jgi:hypothetical protein
MLEALRDAPPPAGVGLPVKLRIRYSRDQRVGRAVGGVEFLESLLKVRGKCGHV